MTNFDLGEPAPDADEEPADDQDESDESAPVDEPATEPEPEPEPDRSTSSSDPEPEPEPKPEDSSSDDTPDPTETGPAFPYSEVDQNPLYAREETWREFNLQRDTELTPALRDEGIMDDELREIHDIVLEIAMDNLDEIPERLKEKRRNQ